MHHRAEAAEEEVRLFAAHEHLEGAYLCYNDRLPVRMH